MKKTLRNIIIEYSSDKKYFSMNELKEYLKSNNYNYSDAAIKKYLKQLIQEKEIYSAGRSFYSRILNELKLETAYIEPIIEKMDRKFPLLKYSLWSTEQLKMAFHHTQNKFFTFIYSEIDSLIYIRDYLSNTMGTVLLNPTKYETEKMVFNSSNTIILRANIIHNLSENKIAPIEKILIDLYIESQRLDFIDESEYKKIFEYYIENYRINISQLLDYAERRKILTKIKYYLRKYTNPTFN